MKKILLACASGIATSTAVMHKVSTILDDKGYQGQYQITQCKIHEAFAMASEYDFCISTTKISGDVKCPVILGVAFLTGIGMDKVVAQVIEHMEKE